MSFYNHWPKTQNTAEGGWMTKESLLSSKLRSWSSVMYLLHCRFSIYYTSMSLHLLQLRISLCSRSFCHGAKETSSKKKPVISANACIRELTKTNISSECAKMRFKHRPNFMTRPLATACYQLFKPGTLMVKSGQWTITPENSQRALKF